MVSKLTCCRAPIDICFTSSLSIKPKTDLAMWSHADLHASWATSGCKNMYRINITTHAAEIYKWIRTTLLKENPGQENLVKVECDVILIRVYSLVSYSSGFITGEILWRNKHLD
jgi:hypothetical protein